MLSRWTKNWLHSINSWDTVTKVVPLWSAFQAPSYELNLCLLTWFRPMLAYLSMLFILELAVQASSRINIMLRWANSVENGASKVRLGSSDGAWYAEQVGTSLVTISAILMEWGKYFVHRDSICQTLVRYTLSNDTGTMTKSSCVTLVFRYLHKTSTVLFIIISAIRWVKFSPSSTIIGRVSSFSYM